MEAAGFNVIYDNKIESPIGKCINAPESSNSEALTEHMHIGWSNKMAIRGAEDMRMLYMSIAPFLASVLKIDVEECKAKINRACDAMGPTKTTVNLWSFLAQKPLDSPESTSA